MREIALSSLPPDSFDDIIGVGRAETFAAALAFSRDALGPRTLWHVNSTANGGGVAEMLGSILSYVVGAGLSCRWAVIDGGEEFFAVTKQLHHALHGRPAGVALDEAARATYEQALTDDAAALCDLVSPGDVVVLNDPQTLGLAPALRRAGVSLVFTSHIGADVANDNTHAGWDFLAPYVAATDRQVFSRPQYVWPGLDDERVAVIPPCIDPFSPKNQELEPGIVTAVLVAAGVVDADATAPAEFTRHDGSAGKVADRAEMIEAQPLEAGQPVVLQVSRWDPLKDHAGVMRGFVEQVPGDAHLVLAGPSPEAISDDPEGTRVFADLRSQWEDLPAGAQRRVHIACLPMEDAEQNAAIVNALQRHARVVVQKSLAEGFGLTVAEAMWKSRPTIGSRVGGIQDQIEAGRSGVLLDDPGSADECGRAIAALLDDPAGAAMGAAARQRVIDRYLPPDHLMRYLELAAGL